MQTCVDCTPPFFYIQFSGAYIEGSVYRRICILCQQTSWKHWFGNMSMTLNCDVTNSPHQIQMTTICHWMNPHENFLFAFATFYLFGVHYLFPIKELFTIQWVSVVLTWEVTETPEVFQVLQGLLLHWRKEERVCENEVFFGWCLKSEKKFPLCFYISLGCVDDKCVILSECEFSLSVCW